VTLLAPLKYITDLKLPKVSTLVGAVRRHSAAVAAGHWRNLTSEATPPASPLEQPSIIPISSAPVPLALTPSEILEQIGTKLRQLRGQQQLSIEDIAARTRIQPRLIQAIEQGHIEMLPEPVYVKGMVKRYGDSLGLDGTAISQQVMTWEPAAATFEPVTKLQATSFNPPIRVKPLHVYLGYTLAIFGIGAGISNLLNNGIKPQSTPVVGVASKPHRAVGIAVVPPVNSTKTVQLPNVPVEIVVKNPAWAQIGIDGATKFTGNLTVGTKLNWTAQKQVTISTNNAGGLIFSQQGQPPNPLGKIGQRLGITIKVSK
jgi:cytoskeletal protein RodZ